MLRRYQPPPIDRAGQLKLALAAARATGPMLPPPVPEVEQRPRGKRHSPERDKRSVQFHYDVSNDFFKLFLDESLTYSCAFFSLDDSSLEAAQFAKLELVCKKLRLEPGMRVLDVGCGWGSFAMHAAREHGVNVVGITLSEGQAELARQRVAEAGLADRIEIRLQDYRELTGEFDAVAASAWSSTSAPTRSTSTCSVCARVLKPGAQFLNHGIARLRVGEAEAGPFSERYVFPDAAPLHVSRIITRDGARRPRDPPRRGLPARLRRDAAPLGAAAGREPRRRPSGSPGPSACASGGSTCAPPARASRPASRRSSRFAARGRSK